MTPGLELAGVVQTLGEGVTGLAIGERVVGIAKLPNGGLADIAIAGAADLHAIPDTIDDVAGAAMYTAFQTSWVALHRRAAIRQ